MSPERQYELIYIVAPVATDAEVETLQAEIDGHVVALGGTVDKTEVWGRRKLAYQIGDYGEGIYICQLVTGPGEMVGELERRLRVRDQVLRHLIVRVDEDLRKARRLKDKKKATVDRRRAARGLPPLPTPSAVTETAAAVETPAAAAAAHATPKTDAAPATPEAADAAAATPETADAAPATAETDAAPETAPEAPPATAPEPSEATSEPADDSTETATPTADAASTDAPAQTPEVKE
jgi:small subunit ribosomal protein S6